jgi:hypothetical protein
MSRKIYPPKFPVHTLSKAFMQNVYKYGRNFELGLGIRYLMKSNFWKLFGTAGFGLSMMRRGRLAMMPSKIRRVNEVRAIIERASKFEE